MARIFVDSFAHGLVSGFWTSMNGTPAVITAKPGMSGSYCLELADGDSVRLTLPSTYASLYVAFKWYSLQEAYSYPCNIISFLNDSLQVLGGLNKGSNVAGGGDFYIVRGTGTFLQTSGIFGYVNYLTHLIEIYYSPSTSSGSTIVRVNGKEIMNFTGQNSDYAGPIRHIHLGWVSTSFWKTHGAYGDIVVDDAAWPGMTRMQHLVPTAAGNSAQWSPSAGSNWDCVEEIPGTFDASVSEDTADQVDLYTMSDLAITPNSIKCVSLQALNRILGAPTANKLKMTLRVGGTNYEGSALSPKTETLPGHLQAIWATNPNTSAAWTVEELNAMEAGVKASM